MPEKGKPGKKKGGTYTQTRAERMAKGRQICAFIASGYTQGSACKKCQVDDSTFMRWKAEYKELREEYIKAKEEGLSFYLEGLGEVAKGVLLQMIRPRKKTKVETWWTYEERESKTTGRKRKVRIKAKEKTYTEDVFPPAVLVIFALRNLFPHIFKDVQEVAMRHLPTDMSDQTPEQLYTTIHGRIPTEEERDVLQAITQAEEEMKGG